MLLDTELNKDCELICSAAGFPMGPEEGNLNGDGVLSLASGEGSSDLAVEGNWKGAVEVCGGFEKILTPVLGADTSEVAAVLGKLNGEAGFGAGSATPGLAKLNGEAGFAAATSVGAAGLAKLNGEAALEASTASVAAGLAKLNGEAAFGADTSAGAAGVAKLNGEAGFAADAPKMLDSFVVVEGNIGFAG